MKKKSKEYAFFCQSCGHCETKWFGKCPSCFAWNSMVEEKLASSVSSIPANITAAIPITQVQGIDKQRIVTGLEELDKVLGGGIVLGSVTLIGGEPGAGKSTLLQMCAANLAQKGLKVLYISAEESIEQIRLSAFRLSALHENLLVLSQTDIDLALEEALNTKPDFLVIDSVQTVSCNGLESAAGSVAQIREVTSKTVRFAKENNIATFLVGHVTKDGAIAGPRLLEHMVDTVLYFEQSRSDHYRMLRAHKNRFGSTNELGLFEMTSSGLLSIKNLSAFFLAQRPKDKAGSAVFCSIEGTRPLLVEIQALATESLFGNPKRTAIGIDTNRVSIVAAILEKHAKIFLSRMDLFVSVIGGIDIDDPALDLALALAITSSVKNAALPFNLIALGELGLSGELRSVFKINERLKEASRLGFDKAAIPYLSEVNENAISLKKIKTIDEAIKCFLA